MITGECYAGEDAEILVEAIKVDYSGEDVDTIQDLVVYVKHYKQTEEVATGATAVWNSNMGQYLVTIPAVYVPASGTFDICVKGSDISDVLIRLQVNTGDDILRTLNIMLTGSVTGLTSGSGSPVTFTGSDGSTVIFTVDANGNRTLSSITLV